MDWASHLLSFDSLFSQFLTLVFLLKTQQLNKHPRKRRFFFLLEFITVFELAFNFHLTFVAGNQWKKPAPCERPGSMKYQQMICGLWSKNL